MGQQRRRPEDIVISKDGDSGGDCFKPSDHLKTLVGFSCPKDLNMMEIKLMTQLSNISDPLSRSDDDDGGRAAGGDGKEAAPEIVTVSQSGDDHGNISVRIGRCAG